MGFAPERVAVTSLLWLGVLPKDLPNLAIPAQVQVAVTSLLWLGILPKDLPNLAIPAQVQVAVSSLLWLGVLPKDLPNLAIPAQVQVAVTVTLARRPAQRPAQPGHSSPGTLQFPLRNQFLPRNQCLGKDYQ